MTAPKALVVGGTGTTGPHVLSGLLERGYDVAMFHRGVHEPPGLPDVEHVHGDPHFAESITAALGTREFDVVVSMYGRLAVIAGMMGDRCGQFIGVTGTIVWENSLLPYSVRPSGMKVLVRESDPLADAHGAAPYFCARVLEAERAVLDAAAADRFRGTVFHYPILYGPNDVVPREWSVLKRIHDKRPFIFVTDAGLAISVRCAARNAAHSLLLAVDRPDVANGESYNVGDDDQFTLRQWMEVLVDIVGGELEIVSIPMEIGRATFAEQNPMEGRLPHALVDTSKIRRELGYKDVVTAKDAMKESVDWLLAHPPNSVDFGSFVDQFDYATEDRLLAAYRRAVEQINAAVPREIPTRRHPMPHPKAPGEARDQAGR